MFSLLCVLLFTLLKVNKGSCGKDKRRYVMRKYKDKSGFELILRTLLQMELALISESEHLGPKNIESSSRRLN